MCQIKRECGGGEFPLFPFREKGDLEQPKNSCFLSKCLRKGVKAFERKNLYVAKEPVY